MARMISAPALFLTTLQKREPEAAVDATRDWRVAQDSEIKQEGDVIAEEIPDWQDPGSDPFPLSSRVPIPRQMSRRNYLRRPCLWRPCPNIAPREVPRSPSAVPAPSSTPVAADNSNLPELGSQCIQNPPPPPPKLPGSEPQDTTLLPAASGSLGPQPHLLHCPGPFSSPTHHSPSPSTLPDPVPTPRHDKRSGTLPTPRTPLANWTRTHTC